MPASATWTFASARVAVVAPDRFVPFFLHCKVGEGEPDATTVKLGDITAAIRLLEDAEHVYAGSTTRDGRFVTLGVEPAQARAQIARLGDEMVPRLREAEWFGEAPANPKACDEIAKQFKDTTHCDVLKAKDEAFAKSIAFWATPRKQCLNGKGNDCVPFVDWIKAWTEIKG